MQTEPKEYHFHTFQDILDRVPGNRIADCLREIGIALAGAKQTSELIYLTAEALAKADGRTLPPMPERLVEWPQNFVWIDDGKGELDVTLHDPAESAPSLHIKLQA